MSALSDAPSDTATAEIDPLDEADQLADIAWDVQDEDAELILAMMAGTARLTDVQQALRADHSGNPYVSRTSLQLQATLCGLDHEGRIGQGAMLYMSEKMNGAADRAAFLAAMCVPAALNLWLQDPEFARAYSAL